MGKDFAEKLRLLEDLIKIPMYSVIGFTHGKVPYVSDQEGVVSLWSLDPETGERIRLTKEPIHGATVSRAHPKSEYVAFTRDVTEGMELQKPFIVSVRGGKEELLADIPPMRFFGLVWDGARERLIFSAASQAGMGLFLTKRGSYEKLMDLATIAYPTDVEEDLIVGCGMLKGNPKSLEIFFYDLKTGEMKIYTPKEGSVNNFPVIRNGKVLFESNFEGKSSLYVYDISSESLEKVEFEHKDYERYDPSEHLAFGWTEDGRIWAVAKKNGRSKPFLDGKEIPAPEGTVGYLGIDEASKKVYYSASSLSSPPKIYEADLEGEEFRAILENPVPKELQEKLGNAYFVKYKSTDGLEIPMYVVESRETEKPGPTLVYVHGGPWSEVYDSWSILILSLVVMGYHVLAPNFRGSTGYGEEFRLKDIGDPGGGDLEDIASAAKWGKENGIAKKVGIIGYSYGGYMTYLALGKKPEIWDVGVAGAGIVDWKEMYSLSDALFKKFVETLFNGLNEELLEDRSPIKYVENVRAPLCIIHPQNDSRTPLKPVLKYIERLLELQRVPFEVHVVPDMGHIMRTTEDLLKILWPAILFLEKYFKKRRSSNPSTLCY